MGVLNLVTRAYVYRQNIIVKGVFLAKGLSRPSRTCEARQRLWVCSPRKLRDFRLSEMVSGALFKQKNSLPMPNQTNVEHFFVFENWVLEA